jgi:D-alanine-D-alanine ligase
MICAVGSTSAKDDDARSLVLHVCGSTGSEYIEGVSLWLGGGCFEEQMRHSTYRHRIARVHLDGTWSFPADYSPEAQAAAEHFGFVDALGFIERMNVDVMVPHMYCLSGMTRFRALFEMMGIPYVGNEAGVMELSTNKHRSRLVVASAGVQVPEAELLRAGDVPKMKPPFVLKPCKEDNSRGISLVTDKEAHALSVSLELAFSFGGEVLCERFIELGREIRCAVLEDEDGSLELLPCTEFFLSQDSPIRTLEDKWAMNESGVAQNFTTGGRKCPADVDDVLLQKLEHLAFRSHRALGCRDYSLFDVRVDPDGNPFFLEACLYNSYFAKSVIPTMAAAKGMNPRKFFERDVDRAIARGRMARCGCQS